MTARSLRETKSGAIVAFLANLLPLYTHEDHDGVWCARSLQDGTLVWPGDESDWEEERGTLRVQWQGDPQRESLVDGDMFTTPILERYVRLHGVGATEEAIAAELAYMSQHFTFKTGCHLYLPSLPEPAHPAMLAGRKALRIGEGLLVNTISKLMGI